MEEKNNLSISSLTHELTLRQYIMNSGNIHKLLRELSIPEYIALHRIAANSESGSVYGDRTYLKDLADKMELSMRQISRMIGVLRDKGLVLWSHDGNGKDGTYVTITENGRALLNSNEEIMTDYYSRVINKFGKENLVDLLRLMKELETVMSGELEVYQEEGAYDGQN